METLSFFQKGMILVVMLSAPALLAAVITGVLTSLVQSLMQIQDQSLPFLLKLLALVTALWLTGRWMSQELTELTSMVLDVIPHI